MPSERLASAIELLQETLKKQEQDARETKRTINRLYAVEGEAVPFPDADADSAPLSAINRDTYYGQPLASAIKNYLALRRNAGRGPATVNELYQALLSGGFVFEAKNAANAKRALYISLGKNSTTFHKLPGGSGDAAVFGLLEWYPNAKADEPGDKKKARRQGRRTPKEKSAKVQTTPKLLPEKGGPNDNSSSAGPAARQKHNTQPVG